MSCSAMDARVELIHVTLTRLSVGYPGPGPDANKAHAALDSLAAELEHWREAVQAEDRRLEAERDEHSRAVAWAAHDEARRQS